MGNTTYITIIMNAFHGKTYKYARISKDDSKTCAPIQEAHLMFAMQCRVPTVNIFDTQKRKAKIYLQ
jgi:hypothetical protein